MQAPSADELRKAGDSVPTLHLSYEMHFERFDPAQGEFHELPPPPTERGLPAVVSSHGRVFVLGGLDPQGNYRSAVDVYDPGTGVWGNAAPWPKPRTANLVELDGLICAIGGFRTPAASLDSVECLDVDANRWRIGAAMPSGPISDFWPVAHQGKIYILGGAQLSFEKWVEPLDHAYAYDPVQDSWADAGTLPAPRAGASLHSIGDQIYVVGGFGARTQDNTVDDGQMLIYAPATGTWSSGPNLPTLRLLYGAATVSDQVVTYFGIGADHVLDRFDPQTATWYPGAEPNTTLDPGVYCSVVLQDSLYLLVLADKLSGSGTSASGKLWRYSVTDDTWSLAGQRAPDTRDAAFIGVAVNDSLYFAGALTNVSH